MDFQNNAQSAKIGAEGVLLVIFNEDKVLQLIKDAPTGSELKIFMFIALNQPQNSVHGFISTKEQLQIDLSLSQTSVFRSIKWLKDNLLIHELKLVDNSDFMVNPYFVMNNSDFQARKDEWSRRCRLDIERELRLRQKKRRNSQKN